MLAVPDQPVSTFIVSYRIKVMVKQVGVCVHLTGAAKSKTHVCQKVLLKGTSTSDLIGRNRGQL